MVQEFKEYDRKYSSYKKGTLMEYEEQMKADGEFNIKFAITVVSWAHKVGKYSNAEIRDAVYFAEGAEEWQKFRVSLKANTTKEKLWRLYKRHCLFCEGAFVNRQEKIRIDNYIGALVRGGQLDTNYKIQR